MFDDKALINFKATKERELLEEIVKAWDNEEMIKPKYKVLLPFHDIIKKAKQHLNKDREVEG